MSKVTKLTGTTRITIHDGRKPYDVTGAIIEYESGTLSDRKTLELFAHLIRTGTVWSLQGHYGRTASALIEDGFITRTGALTEKGRGVD